MSNFDELLDRLRRRFGERVDVVMSVDEPVRTDGVWTVAISSADGHLVEVEWNRHRGFGIAAGRDLFFGGGIDEIYGTVDGAFDRIVDLASARSETSTDAALAIADLRKLRRRLQKDVAAEMGITKSGLNQMERPSSLRSMQVETLRRLIASLGGELVLAARFPDGVERRIAGK